MLVSRILVQYIPPQTVVFFDGINTIILLERLSRCRFRHFFSPSESLEPSVKSGTQ